MPTLTTATNPVNLGINIHSWGQNYRNINVALISQKLQSSFQSVALGLQARQHKSGYKWPIHDYMQDRKYRSNTAGSW
jgi:hypothetical protein